MLATHDHASVLPDAVQDSLQCLHLANLQLLLLTPLGMHRQEVASSEMI